MRHRSFVLLTVLCAIPLSSTAQHTLARTGRGDATRMARLSEGPPAASTAPAASTPSTAAVATTDAAPSPAKPSTAPAPDIAKIKRAAQTHGRMFTYKSGPEDVSAYMSIPAQVGAHPAIIVIHEWWGLNDQIKGVVDTLATKGYVAVAPDLYRGKVTADPKVAMELLNALPDARAKGDLTSLFSYLQMNAAVKSLPIGSIGFCMGGRLSLLLATAEPQLGACVVCYGRPETDPALLEKIQAPVVGIYGGDDTGIPEKTIETFKAQMTKLGKKVEVKIFPGVGHGFLNPNNPGHKAAVAKDAWAMIDAFLKQYMPPPKSPEPASTQTPR